MKLPCLFQPRILKTAIKSLITPAFTTSFPAGEYEPIPEYRGRPRYDEDTCIGCGACAEVCPAECIDVIDNIAGDPLPCRRLVQHLDACLCCGQCERYCTTEKGVTLTNEYDFAGFKPEDFEETIELELLLCECCGEAIAPVAQLRWLAQRLGPQAFCNPTLMLVSHSELAVVEPGVKPTTDEPARGARVSIQCPKCRRKTALIV